VIKILLLTTLLFTIGVDQVFYSEGGVEWEATTVPTTVIINSDKHRPTT